MKVLYIEPQEKPRVIDIPNEWEAMSELVEGIISCISPWEENVGLIHNDNGIAQGLPLNRMINEKTVIFGPFVLVGLTEEAFTDLSEELIEKFAKRFESPEYFVPTSDGNIAVFRLRINSESNA